MLRPSAQFLKFLKQRFDFIQRLFHRFVQLIFVIDQIRLIHIRSDCHRMFCVQDIGAFSDWADVILNVLIVRENHAAAFLMTGEETVESDRDRQIDGFSQLQSDQVVIVDHLHAVGEQNNPAAVQHHHDIAVVALDRQRSGHRAAGDVHDHRKPGA